MADLISVWNHPHNLDPTARIVWEDRRTGDHIYRVRAGYVACIHSKSVPCAALDETFASEEDARAAVKAYHVAIGS